MQGKDVQAASETNVFTGTWLPLLRISFSADHSMDIKKNTFWGARSRTLAGPNLVHKRRQKSISKMTLPWKGVSLIWKGPIAYLMFLTISINFHKPNSVPYMFSIAGVFAVAQISLLNLFSRISVVLSPQYMIDLSVIAVVACSPTSPVIDCLIVQLSWIRCSNVLLQYLLVLLPCFLLPHVWLRDCHVLDCCPSALIPYLSFCPPALLHCQPGILR